MPSLTPVASQLGEDLIVVCFVAYSAVFYHHHLYVLDGVLRPLQRTFANKSCWISREPFIRPSCFYFETVEHKTRGPQQTRKHSLQLTTPRALHFSAAVAR